MLVLVVCFGCIVWFLCVCGPVQVVVKLFRLWMLCFGFWVVVVALRLLVGLVLLILLLVLFGGF